MHPVLNVAMSRIESLVDQAAYHQSNGNEIDKAICLAEAQELAHAIDEGDDFLTMSLLSDVI